MSTFGNFTVTRASTKNVLGSAGLYVSVANNVPAFEFNTDGSYRGLLVEPGATNLALRSQEFNDGSWTKSATGVNTAVGTSGIEANVATAPDGTMTADRVNFLNQADPDTGLSQTYTTAVSQPYTNSIFVKGEGTDIGKQIRVRIRRQTGTANFVNATITLTADWQRVSTNYTTLADNTSVQVVYSSAVGGAVTALIWQAQFELGSVATSYIVTTAGTASRVADGVTLTGASSLIGQSAGTLFVETELPSYNIGANSSCLLAVNVDGASDIFANGIFIGCVAGAVNQPRFRVSASGSNTADIQMSANRPAGIYKFAGAYASNDAAFYANGSSVGTDATVTVGANAEIYIGYSPVTARQQVCWIRSIAIFPTRIPNATLVSLTTP
jgi:hypothetical protein